MVQFQPCNPRPLGKVEQSRHVLRNKKFFDMVIQTRSAKKLGKSPKLGNLPNYMKCLNNEKREELRWYPPFEVYFGRKNNKLVDCSLLENQGSPEVRKILKSTENDFNRFKRLRSKSRKRALIIKKFIGSL